MMVAIAEASASAGLLIRGHTALTGPPLIVDPEGLEAARCAVLDLVPDLTAADGVVVAAFGDPGADELAEALAVPVIGIGEASIREACEGGRRFSIVTTTPLLEPSIRRRVSWLGCAGNLASIRISEGDPVLLTANAPALEAVLHALVDRCVSEDGAEAVIVGGGPLARAARAITGHTPAALIEPVPAAVAWMARRLGLPLTG